MTDAELEAIALKATPGGVCAYYDHPYDEWRICGDADPVTEHDAELAQACTREAILSLLARVRAAEANRRTPGTVEICQHYRTASCGENEDHNNMGACGRKVCPIRQQGGAGKCGS